MLVEEYHYSDPIEGRFQLTPNFSWV